MKHLIQFGTFDVNNYGDLLFPLLAKNALEKTLEISIHPASPTGGRPTELSDTVTASSFLGINEKQAAFHGALIGGGNIIHCLPTKLPHYTAESKGELAYSELWIGPAFCLPKVTPILWNAPGVPNRFEAHQHHVVRRAIQAADYLSVRDERSREFIREVCNDADVTVVPDTAWSLDLLWSKEELQIEQEAIFADLGLARPDRTIVFHINRRYFGQKNLRELAAALDKMARRLEALPILIPFAPCHGDDLIAREVASAMQIRPLVLDAPGSLRRIAATVANAAAYVGSSMHGLITACVYGVPGISVADPSMPKFKGLTELAHREDLVVKDWNTASEILHGQSFSDRGAELIAIKQQAQSAIASHWMRISEEVKAVDVELTSSSGRRGNKTLPRAVSDFKDGAFGTILEGERLRYARFERFSLAEREKSALDHEAKLASQQAISDAELRRLRAKFNRLERSISWRVTRPLRALSQRFPNLGSASVEVMSAVYRRSRSLIRARPPKIVEAPVWVAPSDIEQQITTYREHGAGGRKTVIYTAIFGEYDRLLLPEKIDPNVDYICFTDRELDTFGVWQLRVSPYFHADPTRVARYIKTHPHFLFPEHEYAIWIDANIILRTAPEKYVRALTNSNRALGLVRHPHRDCVYEEAEACKLRRKDSAALLDAQVAFYREQGLRAHSGMYETGFMVVDLSDQLARSLFTIWWQQIDTFSRRDQVGLAWSLSVHAVSVEPLLAEGVSVREDDDFIYFSHKDARKISAPENLTKFKSLKLPSGGPSYASLKMTHLGLLKELPIDIVICVHNALEDVKLCIASVSANLRESHRIIIVNDFSDNETTDYLRSLPKQDSRITLIENLANLGYTQSANKGLAAGNSDFRIILNSDTVVSKDWSLKLLELAMRSDDIGIVGPLSNAAGVQSVPDIKGTSINTAINAIPQDLSYQELDTFLEAATENNAFPVVPLVHGFCMGIKKRVIDRIGYFDAANFSKYYGEENDYCLRATAAGFSMAIATNTFVFHRKSRSIIEEERLVHMEKAGQRLREIYGIDKIRVACQQGEDHPLLIAVRAKVGRLFQEKA